MLSLKSPRHTPTLETYCGWVINALRVLGSATPKQVYRWIRDNETVPEAELAGITPDGENLFEKNVRWARFTLRKRGAVSDRTGRGCQEPSWHENLEIFRQYPSIVRISSGKILAIDGLRRRPLAVRI